MGNYFYEFGEWASFKPKVNHRNLLRGFQMRHESVNLYPFF
jgi:hypothetical protein